MEDSYSIATPGTVAHPAGEIDRLLSTAIQQHIQGNTLAASCSLVALIEASHRLLKQWQPL